MTLTIENKCDFFEIIQELLVLIENLNDGDYLQGANMLKRLHDLTSEIKNTPVYTHIYRVHRRRLVYDNMFTLRNRSTQVCNLCGRHIINTPEALRQHQNRDICKDIQKERELCASFQNTHFVSSQIELAKQTRSAEKIQIWWRLYVNKIDLPVLL